MVVSTKALVIGLIIGLVIGGASGWLAKPIERAAERETVTETISGPKETVTETVSGPTVTVTKTVTPTPTPSPTLTPGEWKLITTFTGSTDKTTEPFYIPSGTWRINWAYTGGKLAAFGFFVFPEGETVMFVESLSTMGPSQSDATYIYEGPGNFYIKLMAGNIDQWTLTIEALVS